ncbi:uncharacterized protein PAC_19242 [Phialocephala subalpina]|uniref:Glycosyltransferase family 92 protein n=1 Tax=Phialocephala subalpina TaxID=576137 RepID=A0A1L7XWA0_9HELO|nr:uncharacterized protein PAC_19242 [Phialocephala subalpina]
MPSSRNRWRLLIILAFCLLLLHRFIILAPPLNDIIPTWAEIKDHVPWEVDSIPEVAHEVGDAGAVVAVQEGGNRGHESLKGGEAGISTSPPSLQDGIAQISAPGEFELQMDSKAAAPTSKPPSPLATSGVAQNGTQQEGMEDEYVAICLAIKDQRRDLPEFLIHHYHHLGIRRYSELGIPRSALTFTYQDQATPNASQLMTSYTTCLTKYSHHPWIAFIDTDEYLEVTSHNETFRQILEEFEVKDNVGALAVSWRMHTSAGFLKRPKEGARKAFTECILDNLDISEVGSGNRYIKSIVRPLRASGPLNAHKFIMDEIETTKGEKDVKKGKEEGEKKRQTGVYDPNDPDGGNAERLQNSVPMRGSYVTVGGNGDVVSTEAFRVPTRYRLALHHYAVRSEEYEERMNTGNDAQKDQKFWDHVECSEMAVYDP